LFVKELGLFLSGIYPVFERLKHTLSICLIEYVCQVSRPAPSWRAAYIPSLKAGVLRRKSHKANRIKR
jgi:hypothetical protein